jgi:hypothetical protein
MARTNSFSTSFRPRLECLEVRSVPSITVLAVNPSPGPAGQPVTMTAYISDVGVEAITPGSGIPNRGTVTFYDGTTALGTVTATPSAPFARTGTAVFTTSSLLVGSHAITAQYSGDAWPGIGGAAAPSTSQVVNVTTNLPLAEVAFDALMTAGGLVSNNASYIYAGLSDYLKMLSFASGPGQQHLALTYFTNLFIDMSLMSSQPSTVAS